MFKYTTLVFLFMLSQWAKAQQDTVFYDARWKETKDKNNYSYYGIDLEKDGLIYRTDFYKFHKPQMTATYIRKNSGLVKDGFCTWYDSNSLVTHKSLYSDGFVNGPDSTFYEHSTHLYYFQHYMYDSLDGDFVVFDSSGYKKRKETYDYGKLVFKECYDKDGKTIPYFPFSEEADFIGGEKALIKHLEKNLTYPKQALKQKLEGVVRVSFVVNEEGDIAEANVLKSDNALFNDEAIRVVKILPKFKPASFDGKKIKSEHIIPIRFQLQ